MKKFLLFLSLLLSFAIIGHAETAEFTFNASSSTSGKSGAISYSTAKNSASNAPGCYSNGLRIYYSATTGGSITFTASDNSTITGITFTYAASGNAFPSGAATVGTLSNSNKTGTWTGSATEVSFYNTQSTNNQVIISKAVVTYETTGEGGSTPEPDPSEPDEPIGSVTDELVTSNFTGIAYGTGKDWTSTSSNATYTAMAVSSNGFQMRTSKQNGIIVKTAPSGMKVSTITINLGTNGGGVSVYAGESAFSIPAANGKPSGTAIRTGITGNNNVVEINAPYFIIVPTNDTYCVVSKVTVNWVSTTGGEEPEPSDVAPTFITFDPDGGEITPSTEISLSADGTNTKITYTIDGETTENAYTEPFTLNEGTHTVYAKAANNGGSISEQKTFNVKATEPEIPSDWVTVNATVIMNNQSDLTYGKDKKIEWISSDGLYRFSTIATITGSTYPTKNSSNLRIYNSNGNTITVTAPDNVYFVSVSAALGNTANHIAIDGNEIKTNNGIYTFSNQANSFSLTSVKNNSNNNSDIASLDFVLSVKKDEQPKFVAPSEIIFEPAAGNITTTQQITLSVDDKATTPVTINYSIDNEAYDQTYSAPFALEAGEHTVYVKATNAGGELTATAKYTVEKVTAYQIDFKTGTSTDGSQLSTSTAFATFVDNGANYLNSISNTSNAYYNSTNGLKLGSSNNRGTVTFELSEEGQVFATKVVVKAASYGTDSNCGIQFNGMTAQTLTSTLSDYTFELDGTQLTQIKLDITGKRGYVKGITVYYGEPEREDYTALEVYAEEGVTLTLGQEKSLELGDDHPKIEYSYNPTGILTIDENGKINTTKVGSVEVTATWAQTNKWNEGSAKFTVVVNKPEPVAPTKITVSPEDGSKITTETEITIEADGTDPEIYYSINGQAYDMKYEEPFTLETSIKTDGPGTYVLYILAKNEIDSKTTSVTYTVENTLSLTADDSVPVESGTEVKVNDPLAQSIYITTYNIDGTPTVKEFPGTEASFKVTEMSRRFDVQSKYERVNKYGEITELFYNIGTATSGTVYKRVNSADELKAGDNIVIGFFHITTSSGDKKNYYKNLMTANRPTSSGRSTAYATVVDNNTANDNIEDADLTLTTLPEGTAVFTLEDAGEGKVKLSYVDEQQKKYYLTSSTSSNSISLSTESPTEYTLKDDNGKVLITSPGNNNDVKAYCLKLNTTYDYICSYNAYNDATAQLPVDIFRQHNIEAKTLTYEMSINFTREAKDEAEPATFRTFADEANESEELTAGSENEGVTNYSVTLPEDKPLLGRFTLSVGINGETVELGGHRSDVNAGTKHDLVTKEDKEGNVETVCDGNHDAEDAYVWVGDSSKSNFKLVNTKDENSVALSTNPAECQQQLIRYTKPTLKVSLDPFKSISLGFDPGTATGVEGVGVDAEGEVEFFNLQGVRVDGNNLVPGVYISRQGNVSSKVLVK